jgi:hypothetical protein
LTGSACSQQSMCRSLPWADGRPEMVLSQRPVVSKLCAFVNFYLIPVISQLLSLELLAILFCRGLDFSRPRCLYPSYIRVLNLQLLDFCCSSDICARRISRTLWCSLGRWGIRGAAPGWTRTPCNISNTQPVIEIIVYYWNGRGTHVLPLTHVFLSYLCGLRLALDPALVAFRDMPIFQQDPNP